MELTSEERFNYRQDTRDHIGKVQTYMDRAVVNLAERSTDHDASKFLPEEAEIYAAVIPLFKGKEYGTPEHKAVGGLLGPAWVHHLEHNDHHPDHWENGINDMSLLSIIEMVCDWKAASLRDPNQVFIESCKMNCDKYGADEQLTSIIMNTADELGMF